MAIAQFDCGIDGGKSVSAAAVVLLGYVRNVVVMTQTFCCQAPVGLIGQGGAKTYLAFKNVGYACYAASCCHAGPNTHCGGVAGMQCLGHGVGSEGLLPARGDWGCRSGGKLGRTGGGEGKKSGV